MPRLLVIEDEPEVRRHVRQALEVEGYFVLTAANGHEGLGLLREEAVDLVLVDLLMPGMDGLELIRQLHRTCLTAKIIAMSGGIGDWNYLQVASYLGAHTTLQKPFSRQMLLDVVRAQLSP